jgi:hypothetical protein
MSTAGLPEPASIPEAASIIEDPSVPELVSEPSMFGPLSSPGGPPSLLSLPLLPHAKVKDPTARANHLREFDTRHLQIAW